MKIIVGIVIYRNDLDLLLKNLAMFSQQTVSIGDDFDLNIVLLDNDEGRQIEEIESTLKKNLDPDFIDRISLISSPNIGFGAGHNKIFAKAKQDGDFDYYLCANPDGIPHGNMLNEMVSFAKKKTTTGFLRQDSSRSSIPSYTIRRQAKRPGVPDAALCSQKLFLKD